MMKDTRQGTDAAPMTQAGTRLRENSSGGRGNHLGKKEGESFAWDHADKYLPNPQQPVRKG